ncbi:MAG: ECF transporter S component, partial [Clostridia bacterium]|nr:ECF transporter S component [Clostridia bacterium]
MSKNKERILRLTLTAMFLALGLVLPFLTGQIPQIGSMLLPMHIPVFLCALICGWQYATPMAFILPILRSLIFSMPPMYPTA